MLDIRRVLASAPKKPTGSALEPLLTPWGEKAQREEAQDEQSFSPRPIPLSEHPHPQFAREGCFRLDGWWDYAIVANPHTSNTSASVPHHFDGLIRVPFSPEAPLSGVNRQLKPSEFLWYRRTFTLPDSFAAERCIILHFEAVDYACACYCNGRLVGTHVGGYLPFFFDITDALLPKGGTNEITLCVTDPSDDGMQLRGKQRLQRGGIWYTAQSGIWQTVWLESVPKDHIDSLEIDAPDTGRLTLSISLRNPNDLTAQDTSRSDKQRPPQPLIVRVLVRVLDGGTEVGRAEVGATTGDAPLPPVTIDISNPRLWSPEDPHLYQLELTYGDDRVRSYCAFRTVTIETVTMETATMEPDVDGITRLRINHLCINHKPYFLRGVLDQGYWPDGLLTAPSAATESLDDALIFDIEAMKNLGFTMLRKHIKIESDRWYYHCDRLGMLVWQDMVSGGTAPDPWHTSIKPTLSRWSWSHYRDDTEAHYRHLGAGGGGAKSAKATEGSEYRREWVETCAETVRYLKNHPSIITWVLFNEAWGQFDARRATAMVRELDPTRPIDAVSGWYDQGCGDFVSVHNYFRPLAVYADAHKGDLNQRSHQHNKRAFVISEFGGLSYHVPGHSSLETSYGYGNSTDQATFTANVRKTLAQADALESQGLAGFVYTQLSDVEEETNGLLTYDRRINKLD